MMDVSADDLEADRPPWHPATKKVPNSMRSQTTLVIEGPQPRGDRGRPIRRCRRQAMSAPMLRRASTKSTTSGSRAALRSTGGAACQARGQQEVLGAGDRGHVKDHFAALQTVRRLRLDVAVLDLQCGAELHQALEVLVHRPGADRAAAGQATPARGQSGPAGARAPKSRRAWCAPGRTRPPCAAHALRPCAKPSSGAAHLHPHAGQDQAQGAHVGQVGGWRADRLSPGASKEAAIIGKEAFLEPETLILPRRSRAALEAQGVHQKLLADWALASPAM